MAGLFSSGEQDMLGNIVQQRQQANQALGQNYGKYSGIVQAGAGMADIGADAMFGGKTGASDPRMQQMNEVKNIFSQVAMEVGNTTSAAFYNKLAQAWSAKFPEQAAKAAEKAKELEGKEFEGNNRTRNVYRIITTKDTYGINDIEKQVMVTQEWRNGKWVDVGTPQELPENSRGKNFNDPRLNGGEQKKPRGEVEIGAAIQDKIGAEIKLPPLKDQGGNLQGAEPEGMPPADEKPMLFPKQSELKAAHNRQRMLLTELKKLREQGKSTTQIERLIRDNKDKITIMESRLGNK
jgi:hypothetical protein